MQRCDFCTRWFRNKQATRAHLRYCEWYARRESKRPGSRHFKPPAPDHLCERCEGHTPGTCDRCGPDAWQLPLDQQPKQCRKCKKWQLTGRVDWQRAGGGRCLTPGCGEPMTEEALRQELERRELLELAGELGRRR